MGQEYNVGIIISDNTIFFKMAANMAAKSHQKPYLSSKSWYKLDVVTDFD